MGQLIEKVVENNILLIFAVTDNVRINYEVRTTPSCHPLTIMHYVFNIYVFF